MLKGEKVYLRLVDRMDINILYRICADKDVRKYNVDIPDKQYILNNFEKIQKFYRGALTIINEKGVIIGWINYSLKDKVNSIYTLGITIGRKFWGRGYGKDAIITLSQYLFYEKNAEGITLEVAKPNIRAIKCYEKCGFINREVKKNNFKTSDEYVDTIIMYLYEDRFNRQVLCAN